MYSKDVFDRYKSNSQRVRVITEEWMKDNMFCPICLNLKINKLPNNTPIADFSCEKCSQNFQLKSQKNDFSNKINDGAFQVMIDSILRGIRPNFLLLNYGADYYINNLFLIPYFFFTESVIEKRKPLSESAKRHGWVGCNILLSKVPPEGRITIIKDRTVQNKRLIAKQWNKISFMKNTPLVERGWTVDILRIIHSIGKNQFNLKDAYSFEEELAKEHPKNYHIKDKIRQQLQILRDRKILKFLGNGNYLITK